MIPNINIRTHDREALLVCDRPIQRAGRLPLLQYQVPRVKSRADAGINGTRIEVTCVSRPFANLNVRLLADKDVWVR